MLVQSMRVGFATVREGKKPVERRDEELDLLRL